MKSILKISATVAALVFSTALWAETFSVKSPDGKIEAMVEDGAQLKFSLKADGKFLLENCPVGISTDKGSLGKDSRVESFQNVSNDSKIQTVFGIRKTVDDKYNQLVLNFKDWQMLVRVYDEAAAYRFISKFDGQIVVKDETLDLVSIKDSDNVVGHFVNAWQSSCERPWTYTKAANVRDFFASTLPFFFQKDGVKVAVVDSSISDYPSMRIAFPKDAKSIRAVFAPAPLKIGFSKKGKKGTLSYDAIYKVEKVSDYIAKTDGSRAFPWRGFIVGRNDADFADNDTVYKLAEPCKLADTSWIKFGTTTWDWWVDWNIEGVPFQTGFNNETCKYYVDFAAEHNIPFITLDAGWHVGRGDEGRIHYNDDEFFLNGKPVVDIPDIVKYADSKNIKVIIWIFSKVLYDQPVRTLDLMKKWGVAGLKIDFTDRDDQWATRHYANITKLAAERHILIDWHGCAAPTGLHRTYPNAVNFEAVYGAEVNKFPKAYSQITPKHNIDLVFTRMLSGPMDYTPGGMRNYGAKIQPQSAKLPCVQGTRAHMMAQYILFYSPLQMLSDMPSDYLRFPDILKFLAETPTSWDDTKVLDAKMGEYVVIARRSGKNWYVGAMSVKSKSVFIDFSKFLGDGSFKLELFRDGINTPRVPTDYVREVKRGITSSDSITVDIKDAGGFAIKLSR